MESRRKKEDTSSKKESKENLDITVSAAASLTEALTEIQKNMKKKQELSFNNF